MEEGHLKRYDAGMMSFFKIITLCNPNAARKLRRDGRRC